VRADLARISQVRSWLDAREIADRRRLEDFRAPFGATPDQELARSANLSRRDAGTVNSRAAVCDQVPELADALTDGAVTGAHVDVLGRGLKVLEPRIATSCSTTKAHASPASPAVRHPTSSPEPSKRPSPQHTLTVGTAIWRSRSGRHGCAPGPIRAPG
jgi:hypothetical protein